MRFSKIIAVFLAAGLLWPLGGGSEVAAANARTVPPQIYEWAHSTERAGYYFNKQQMNYAIDADGVIDLNTLIVPTLIIYDDVQISDVVAKRRWNQQPLDGYGDLVGGAQYLRFDLAKNTVTVTEKHDLDSTWSSLSIDKPNTVIELEKLSPKSVDRCFYESILLYSLEHQDELIKRSWGHLSEADAARLAPAAEPAAEAVGDGQKDKKKHKKDKKKRDKQETPAKNESEQQ